MAEKAFRNLDIGDVLLTKSGEYYIYLGHYEGTPRSFYNVPDQGHLYMFYGREHSYSRINIESVKEHLEDRSKDGFEGNFSYTKNPKKFAEKLENYDIYSNKLHSIIGLKLDEKFRKDNDLLQVEHSEDVIIEKFIYQVNKEFSDSCPMYDDNRSKDVPNKITIQSGLNSILITPQYDHLISNDIDKDITVKGAYGQIISDCEVLCNSRYQEIKDIIEIVKDLSSQYVVSEQNIDKNIPDLQPEDMR